jgi:hypothetical protein
VSARQNVAGKGAVISGPGRKTLQGRGLRQGFFPPCGVVVPVFGRRV